LRNSLFIGYFCLVYHMISFKQYEQCVFFLISVITQLLALAYCCKTTICNLLCKQWSAFTLHTNFYNKIHSQNICSKKTFQTLQYFNILSIFLRINATLARKFYYNFYGFFKAAGLFTLSVCIAGIWPFSVSRLLLNNVC